MRVIYGVLRDLRYAPEGMSPTELERVYPFFEKKHRPGQYVVVFPWTESPGGSIRGWLLSEVTLDRLALFPDAKEALRGHRGWHVSTPDFDQVLLEDPRVDELYWSWPELTQVTGYIPRRDRGKIAELKKAVAEEAYRLGVKHGWCKDVRTDVEGSLEMLGIPPHKPKKFEADVHFTVAMPNGEEQARQRVRQLKEASVRWAESQGHRVLRQGYETREIKD